MSDDLFARDWPSAPLWALGSNSVRAVEPAHIADEATFSGVLYLVVAAAFPDPHAFVRCAHDIASGGARAVATMLEPPQNAQVLDALPPGCVIVHPDETPALLAWRVRQHVSA